MIVDYDKTKHFADSESTRKALKEAEVYINRYVRDNNLDMNDPVDVLIMSMEFRRYLGC